MKILCLDLEGVLIPEIWQAVAERTGIDALNKTTRDIPIYDDLMQYRLAIVTEHGLTMSLIREVVDAMQPLDGATAFLDWARSECQVIIVSDTFYEFAQPIMAKLGQPTLLCHRLLIEADCITGYRLRQPDPKRRSIQAFKSLQFTVIAAGDSYNDVAMLEEADAGFFFCAPDNVLSEYPQYPAAASYSELRELVHSVSG